MKIDLLRCVAVSICSLLLNFTVNAQARWDGLQPIVVDFDQTIEGAINGPFAGDVASQNPSRGEIDSNFWSNTLRFGRASKEMPQGGGIFTGYDTLYSDCRFWAVEPGAGFGRIFALREMNDYSNDSLFRFVYTGQKTLRQLTISFDAFTIKLDPEQMSGYRATVSFDEGATYVRVPELDIAPSADEQSDAWYHRGKLSATLDVSVSSYSSIILQFSSHSVKGYGDGRTMVGWDNITLSAK